MYTIEKNKPFYSTLNNLIYTYHYPTEEDLANLNPFYIKFTIVQMVCFIFYCVGVFAHLVVTLKDNTGLGISEDCSVLIGNLGSIMTCTLFTLQYRNWSDFFNNIADTSKFGKPADFDAITIRSNLFARINVWYANIGIIIYGAASLAEASDCQRMSREKSLHEICGSYVPIWLPVEGYVLVVIMVFTAQIIMAYYFIAPSAALCFIPWEASQIATSHIHHFKSNFSKVFEESTFQGRRDRLRFCVQYHNHILRMLNQLNDLVKFTVGIMTMISAIVFGCLENQIFKTKPMGAAIYLMAYMVAIFWSCYAGQIIKDETLSISDILYDVNWYEAEVSIMKDLKFIIARAQKPIYLDALPIGTLNYALFVTIIKTSYSYLTLLNQTT